MNFYLRDHAGDGNGVERKMEIFSMLLLAVMEFGLMFLY